PAPNEGDKQTYQAKERDDAEDSQSCLARLKHLYDDQDVADKTYQSHDTVQCPCKHGSFLRLESRQRVVIAAMVGGPRAPALDRQLGATISRGQTRLSVRARRPLPSNRS